MTFIEKMVDFFENLPNKIWGFVKRNTIWVVLSVLTLLYVNPSYNELRVFFIAVFTVFVALFLSKIWLNTYLTRKETRDIIYGEDGKLNSVEATALMRLQGSIIIGISIILGCVMLGTFYLDKTF